MAHDDKGETISELIARTGLTMEVVLIPTRTDDIEMSKDSSHWRCTIKKPSGYYMDVEYSMGAGHRVWKKPQGYVGDWTQHDIKRFGYKVGERVGQNFLSERKTLWIEKITKELTEPSKPDLASVLDCLASDASGYDNAANFGDWASEYGYSDDSIKAKHIYDTCATQAKQLRHLLGDDYDTLLYGVERL